MLLSVPGLYLRGCEVGGEISFSCLAAAVACWTTSLAGRR
jgi:hypothetical protein